MQSPELKTTEQNADDMNREPAEDAGMESKGFFGLGRPVTWVALRKRIFEIIEVGAPEDYVSRAYDFINMFAIVVNLTISVLMTFAEYRQRFGRTFLFIEAITVAFFALDYLLRLLTAKCKYPRFSGWKALGKYIASFNGIVDMLSFLPYYLPIFFPAGSVAF